VGTAGDGCFECGEILLALFFQRDGDDNRRDESERSRFEVGPIAANDAGFLELTNAARAGGRRQPDLLGELDLARPRIGEQLSQNPKINAIQLCHASIPRYLPLTSRISAPTAPGKPQFAEKRCGFKRSLLAS